MCLHKTHMYKHTTLHLQEKKGREEGEGKGEREREKRKEGKRKGEKGRKDIRLHFKSVSRGGCNSVVRHLSPNFVPSNNRKAPKKHIVKEQDKMLTLLPG